MVPPGGIRGGRPRLRGPSTLRPQTPGPQTPPPPVKKRVLFVCIGNSCRSQMAEAFARAYGSDVIEARSAGVNPAAIIAPLTRQILSEKNINIETQFPKALAVGSHDGADIVVNMSGTRLTLEGARVIEWSVTDPIGQKIEVYRSVANQIEGLVMRLILELRSAPK